MQKKIINYSLLYAYINKPIIINYLARKLIPTNLYLKWSITNKIIFLIRKQLINFGIICVIHFAKKIYRKPHFYKQVQIIMINMISKNIIIYPNEKLAIIDLYKEPKIKWIFCYTLSKSKRKNKGFGSTGI
ncbi:dCTP deaminase/dUTPase family protein [Blattabacterium cuenoti]|uniref:deoxyuridine 5'-triphosphate nucleotidohydrolase n=1 Tax=Blattabacterium cuenoti TaxID=1653831 RepID=UPI00163C6ED1|nr:deoxyuridine 5'-triphosphate nucleotidohydrolase [Blattabacterium cuenoti]